MILTTRVFALLAVGALAACDDAPPEQRQPASAAKPVPPPTVARVANDMVAAVSAGKTATAVGVHFALGKVPAVGEALPIEIAIVPHRKFAALEAHFTAPDGLNLTVGETFGPRTDVDAEKSIQHQLVLLPTREGVFMMTASVNTDGEEGSLTRIFSIPVIVSPAQAASTPAEKPKTTPADPAAN